MIGFVFCLDNYEGNRGEEMLEFGYISGQYAKHIYMEYLYTFLKEESPHGQGVKMNLKQVSDKLAIIINSELTGSILPYFYLCF
jgi:hypothetical protein